MLMTNDTATGYEGVATTYARSDHTHHANLSNGVPKKDSRTGTADTANIYSSSTHQHPLNVDPTTANFSLVNATAAANIYQLTQHVYTQEQVAVPRSASGALKAAGWMPPTLNKVLGTQAGPVETLHSGVGAVMGVDSRLAGRVSKYLNKDFKNFLQQKGVGKILHDPLDITNGPVTSSYKWIVRICIYLVEHDIEDIHGNSFK
ncbi:MAG: hypothetical protein EZS28_033298, partial [Streblomastix strix]